eukprot:CFRG2865T1
MYSKRNRLSLRKKQPGKPVTDNVVAISTIIQGGTCITQSTCLTLNEPVEKAKNEAIDERLYIKDISTPLKPTSLATTWESDGSAKRSHEHKTNKLSRQTSAEFPIEGERVVIDNPGLRNDIGSYTTGPVKSASAHATAGTVAVKSKADSVTEIKAILSTRKLNAKSLRHSPVQVRDSYSRPHEKENDVTLATADSIVHDLSTITSRISTHVCDSTCGQGCKTGKSDYARRNSSNNPDFVKKGIAGKFSCSIVKENTDTNFEARLNEAWYSGEDCVGGEYDHVRGYLYRNKIRKRTLSSDISSDSSSASHRAQHQPQGSSHPHPLAEQHKQKVKILQNSTQIQPLSNTNSHTRIHNKQYASHPHRHEESFNGKMPLSPSAQDKNSQIITVNTLEWSYLILLAFSLALDPELDPLNEFCIEGNSPEVEDNAHEHDAELLIHKPMHSRNGTSAQTTLHAQGTGRHNDYVRSEFNAFEVKVSMSKPLTEHRNSTEKKDHVKDKDRNVAPPSVVSTEISCSNLSESTCPQSSSYISLPSLSSKTDAVTSSHVHSKYTNIRRALENVLVRVGDWSTCPLPQPLTKHICKMTPSAPQSLAVDYTMMVDDIECAHDETLISTHMPQPLVKCPQPIYLPLCGNKTDGNLRTPRDARGKHCHVGASCSTGHKQDLEDKSNCFVRMKKFLLTTVNCASTPLPTPALGVRVYCRRENDRFSSRPPSVGIEQGNMPDQRITTIRSSIEKTIHNKEGRGVKIINLDYENPLSPSHRSGGNFLSSRSQKQPHSSQYCNSHMHEKPLPDKGAQPTYLRKPSAHTLRRHHPSAEVEVPIFNTNTKPTTYSANISTEKKPTNTSESSNVDQLSSISTNTHKPFSTLTTASNPKHKKMVQATIPNITGDRDIKTKRITNCPICAIEIPTEWENSRLHKHVNDCLSSLD